MELCSRCGVQPVRLLGQRYCRECHNSYMRVWRIGHQLNEAGADKARIRAYSASLKKRGHLTPTPCWVCDAPDVQMHHPDYDNPRDVRWLCERCHRQLHQGQPEPWWFPGDNRI